MYNQNLIESFKHSTIYGGNAALVKCGVPFMTETNLQSFL